MGRRKGDINSDFIPAKKWITEDGLFLIECWARDGYTNEDICKRMGNISHETFRQWRMKYPQIQKALENGKEIVDYKVENALLKIALGDTVTETKTYISAPDKFGNRRTRTETFVKENSPNPLAIIMWLNNRQSEKWKRNRDQFQELNSDDRNITVNIIKSSDAQKEILNNCKSSSNKKSVTINEADYEDAEDGEW